VLAFMWSGSHGRWPHGRAGRRAGPRRPHKVNR
jgi:hypothetical protein